jgi:hypothetical protein
MERAMRLYTALLRIIIHVFVVFNLIGFTYAGAAYGPVYFTGYEFGGPVAGAVIGFVAGLVFVGLFAGIVALLFEVRDSLKVLRDASLPYR